MNFLKNPSLLKVDALKELGNIGAAHAVTGISKLLNQRVDISVTHVDIIKIQEIMDVFDGPESMVSVTCVEGISEKVIGNMFLAFPQHEANKLIELITGKPGPSDIISDEYDLSVLKEVGNIMCACYLNTLATILNKKIIHSVPLIIQERMVDVIGLINRDKDQNSDFAVLLETKFELASGGSKGKMFFISTSSSLDEIFNVIGLN